MATIKDIAKEAKVSPATVSKALNSRHDVSEETRKRILDIARTLNFVPNAIGKNLRTQKTENIGVIFCRESQPLSGNPFYSRVLEGVEAELAINNYNLILHLLPNDLDADIPKMVRERQVDGVILGGVMSQKFVNRLSTLKIPVVMIDPKINLSNVNQVLIDNEHGAFQAVQYLIENGHERIGFISGDLDRLSFIQRFKGYRKALEYARIPFEKELVQTGGLEKGYEHTETLLKLKRRPTAIFAANDINAIYGYKAIKDHHYRIPEDVSVVGFDDIELSRIASPPLTTVRVYKEEMGSLAVRQLLQMISKELSASHNTMIPTRIVERESVMNLK